MPFTIDEFLGVFADYNQTIWPFQFAFYAAALVILYLIVKRKSDDKIISGLLAFFWIWTGTVYHIIFFAEINPAAYAFGAIYIIEGLLLIKVGIIERKLSFANRLNYKGIIGWIFIAYALIVYPILNNMLGHAYPKMPTFGLPCPTTIFTFGVLLMTIGKIPAYLIVIPLIWSMVGISAAMNLNVYEDIGLIIAGILGSAIIILEKRSEGARQGEAANL
jgi:hypothetical protein